MLCFVDPHESVYNGYVQALDALTKTTEHFATEAILRRFEWMLLTACSFHMSLTHDAHSDMPINMNYVYCFVVSEGFILADECVSMMHLLQWLLADMAISNAAKLMMRKAFDHVLDGKITKYSRVILNNEKMSEYYA